MLTLVEVRRGTLRKGEGRQLCRRQIRPVDGQRGRLRLRAEGAGQLRAEEAAQLLLHQGFFLLLGGLCYQQAQRHTGENQNADHNNIAIHKGQNAPGDHQNNA